MSRATGRFSRFRVVLTAIIVSQLLGAAPLMAGGDGPASRPAPLQLGADISSLPQVEAGGGAFKDGGKPGDLLVILKNHGLTHARLRIWNHPKNGECGLEQTLVMARRLKRAGLPLLLDFHYADTWADPGHQRKPAEWAALHGPALERAIYVYTRDVIAALDRQETPPEIVQVGNEITAGFLWDDGRVGSGEGPAAKDRWGRFAGLLKAGIRGVREGRAAAAGAAAEPIRVMIHTDRGGDNGGCRWFFDQLRDEKVEFDVIGVSYYPWWHGSLAQLRSNLDDLSVRYAKDLIVVETGYPSSPKGVDPKWQMAENFPATPGGQRAFLAALVEIVKQTAGGRGKGVYYWEPAWLDTPKTGSQWNNRGLFDADGEMLDSINGLTGR